MRKIKFEFDNAFSTPVTEIFEFEDDTKETEIIKYFEDWFFNELDRAGICSFFEEVE